MIEKVNASYLIRRKNTKKKISNKEVVEELKYLGVIVQAKIKCCHPYLLVIRLAIDFPGKKRIFIMNNTTREMIRDIFLTNSLSKLSKYFFFIFLQIFTNDSIRKWIEITLDIQNDIHDTKTRKIFLSRKNQESRI